MAFLPERCRADLERFLEPRLFQALCDPARIAILSQLAAADRELTVSDVSTCCGVHLSGASRHLAILREAGIVSARKCGRQVFYRANVGELAGTLRGLADALVACGEAEVIIPMEELR